MDLILRVSPDFQNVRLSWEIEPETGMSSMLQSLNPKKSACPVPKEGFIRAEIKARLDRLKAHKFSIFC